MEVVMGMFDNTYGAKNYTPATLAAEVGTGLADMAGGAFGMRHEEDLVLDVMKNVNPDDLTSVISGYKEILAINPDAAVEYKAQMMPFVEARQQQIQVDTAKAKAKSDSAKKYAPTELEKERDFFAKNIKANNPDMSEQEVLNLALKKAQEKTFAPSTVAQDESTKAYIKDASKFYDETSNVYKSTNDINRLLEINNKVRAMNVAGKISGSDLMTYANKALANFGLFEDRASSIEEFDSIVTNFVNNQMQSASGTQTDSDELRYVRALASRKNTPEGNKRILEYAKQQSEDLKELRLLRSNWDKENTGKNTFTIGDWNIIQDKFWKKKIAERKKNRPTDETKPTPKKKLTDTDIENAMKNLKDGTSKDKTSDIQTMFDTVVGDGGDTQESLQKTLDASRARTRSEFWNPFDETPYLNMEEYGKLKEFKDNEQAPVVPQAPAIHPQFQPPQPPPQPQRGLLNGTALDAVKDAVFNSPTPTGLLQQRIQQTAQKQQQDRRVSEGKARLKAQQERERVEKSGKPITTWKKVKVFSLSAPEKQAWRDFVKTVPKQADGTRPKGWSIPFKKMICESRPECSL